MNVAIVGNTGYIAGFLNDRLKKKSNMRIWLYGRNSDADEFLDLEYAKEFPFDVLNGIDYVLFTAAVSAPDTCVQEFERCWKINVIGTSYFINEAIKRKCHVIFFSSDAVYGDIQGTIYNEKSKTNPMTSYGKMKKVVEDEFMGSAYFKSIRLSYVVSANDKFIKYCLNCIQENKKAEIFHPFYRNCITASEVAAIVCWMLGRWESFSPCILNAAGQELISRVRIADEINRLYKNRLQYSIVQPDDYFFENRPQITQIESIYMEEYHILENKPFTTKIKEELENVKL